MTLIQILSVVFLGIFKKKKNVLTLWLQAVCDYYNNFDNKHEKLDTAGENIIKNKNIL